MAKRTVTPCAGALLAACVLAGVLTVQATLTRAQPIAPLPEVHGWSMAAALMVPRSEHSIALLDGRIYAIGGYPYGRIPSNVVQVYTVASNSWALGPPLPVPLHHTVAAAAGGRLYVIGGEFEGAGTGRPEQYVDTVYELDAQAGSWRRRAAMPTGRSGAGGAVIDGKIYVAGGRPPRGADFAVYDPAADRWTVLPNLPTQRNHLAVDAIDGKVYVAGGRFGAGFNSETTAVLEIFDPGTNRWTTGVPMPAPRGGVAGVAANGCLFVIGGEGNPADPRGLFDQNEAYNPRTNAWIKLPPMPTPTHGLTGAAFVNGRIHLPGGAITQGGHSGSVIHWVYRPTITCR
jgi:N-acetylneuraminic acid mutarotase